jgi:transcriptional regulator with XRE-family HTH domain
MAFQYTETGTPRVSTAYGSRLELYLDDKSPDEEGYRPCHVVGGVMSLGTRIQDLRRKRGLTTRELATGVQVTSSLISQIEHGKTSPSLDTLRRIAKALGVPLTYLLIEDDLEPQVTHKKDRHVIQLGASGLKAAILSPLPHQQLELVLLELPPRKVSWAKSRSHEGQECHLVVKGTIRAYYGEKTYLLEEGATILWDGTVPHRMENVGDTEAQLLIALTPPAFLSVDYSEEGEAGECMPSQREPRRQRAGGQAGGGAGRSSRSRC